MRPAQNFVLLLFRSQYNNTQINLSKQKGLEESSYGLSFEALCLGFERVNKYKSKANKEHQMKRKQTKISLLTDNKCTIHSK